MPQSVSGCRTENDLMKLPFRQAFGFRIGFLIPAPGQKRVLKYYRYIAWLIPLVKMAFPGMISTMNQVILAMIYVAQQGYERNVIYVKDIKRMAKLNG